MEVVLYISAALAALAIYGALVPGEKQQRRRATRKAAKAAARQSRSLAETAESITLPDAKIPSSELSTTETPDTEISGTEISGTEIPSTEIPNTERSTIETDSERQLPALQTSDAQISDAQTPSTQPAQTSGEERPASTQDSPAAELPAPLPIEFPPEAPPDIPLAASLSISEVVHPSTHEVPEFHFASDPSEDEPEAAHLEVSHNLRQELAELEEGDRRDQQVAHLAQYLSHPDSTTRAAVAWTLGELAMQVQGREREEIINLLDQLSQDASAQVRLRAVSALGKLRSPQIG